MGWAAAASCQGQTARASGTLELATYRPWPGATLALVSPLLRLVTSEDMDAFCMSSVCVLHNVATLLPPTLT